jgi:hypothetical protein
VGDPWASRSDKPFKRWLVTNSSDKTRTSAPLVLDEDGDHVRRFRSTTALPDMGPLDTSGLAALRCSGSAQPSVAAFRDLTRRLEGVRDHDLLVLDLRQESHGFLNGMAVSWYAESNWGAAGLSDADALALEAARLGLLALATTVRVSDAASVKRGAPLATDWERRDVADEARAFARPAGGYVRLPVIDHARPGDATVERFLELVRGLADTTHMHVHCRGGKGRTATFLCMYDMIRNAARLPRATIFARQARLGGYDLCAPANPGSKKAPFIADRRAFLDRFHDYARDNPEGRPLGWMQWLAAQTATT